MKAIAINLNQLRALLKEFIAERGGDDDLLRQLMLSDFLIWIANKQEIEHAQEAKRRTNHHEPLAYLNRRRPADH